MMITTFLKRIASSSSNNSLAASLRRKRFRHFLTIVERRGGRPLTILDVGGWESYWEIQDYAETMHRIILLNREQVTTHHSRMSSMAGDARTMDAFSDQSIDIVFSNSVIEHLGTMEDQMRMAGEVRRIGRSYYVQTPSYCFPLEPHFLFPFFHWLPVSCRVFLVQHFSLGYFKKQATREDAERLVGEHRLLTKAEFQSLFPEASIIVERFMGFTKSYIAVKF